MWQEKAACRGEDPNLFFPEHYRAIVTGSDPGTWREVIPGRHTGGLSEREIQARREDMLETAKAICLSCPVQAECLKEGEDHLDWFGIRAGLDGDARKARYRNRQRRKPAGSYKRVVSPVVLHEPGKGTLSLYRKGCPCGQCRDINTAKGVSYRERLKTRERVSA